MSAYLPIFRLPKLGLFVLIVLTAGCGGGGGDAAAPAATPPPVAFSPNSVQEALTYAVDRGVDGIWVYIDEGDGLARVETAGFANKVSNKPATANSQFKIASVSKLFVAVSVTKLTAQSVIRLDDTVAFWLPALAGRIQNADSISIRNLLQHRSGVPDFDSQSGFSWLDAHTDNDELLALAMDKPADFAPNARYEYSNTNYLLLGMILDTALGYSHHDYVQSEILSPLGMLETYSLQSETDSALLAHGYWDGVDRTEQAYVAPGGSMVSTVKDTGVFMRELATGSLLTDAERVIYTSLFDNYAHSGWLPGYQSIARYNSATNTVLVQFVNTTGGNSEEISTENYELVLRFLRNN
ncbi:MAG: serine hydrolase domain-containing protein [Gammaproteobacteria bacterium]